MNDNSRSVWLDILKLFAICAVLIDHTGGFLYKNPMISWASYCSVTLFVLISGINAYSSNKKHYNENWLCFTMKKIGSIFIPYAIATAAYLFYSTGKLDWTQYSHAVTNFSASAPFYFVLFYIQLLIVSRLLFIVIESNSRKKFWGIWHGVTTIVILLLSSFFIQYTYILSVYGGGQFLLGGTYFFLYYLGMLYGKYHKNVKLSLIKSIITFCTSLILIVVWFNFFYENQMALDNMLKYFGRINPPGISLSVYAILILICGWSCHFILKNRKWIILEWIGKILSFLGKYTLYIFLYHLLIIDIFKKSFIESAITDITLKRIVYYGGIILISVLIGFGMDKIKQYFKSISKEVGKILS